MDSRLFALLRIMPADCGLAAGKDKEAGAAIYCDKPVPKSLGTEETHRKRSGEAGLAGACLHVCATLGGLICVYKLQKDNVPVRLAAAILPDVAVQKWGDSLQVIPL